MYIIDDGIRLNAVLEEPNKNDHHRLAVLLHGFTSSKDRPHNIKAAEAMREAGFSTLRPDLFGHGESEGHFQKHTLFKWISNTITVIDQMRENGYTDLYLSGHSQGGLVAAISAGMESDRIRGLILRAPAFMIPGGAREGSLLGQQFNPEHIPDSILTIKNLKLDGDYLRTAQLIYPEDAVERYNGPVLIIHGTEDDVVPLNVSEAFAKRYKDCELAVIPGETHHFDRYPDKMQEIIRNWIERQQ